VRPPEAGDLKAKAEPFALQSLRQIPTEAFRDDNGRPACQRLRAVESCAQQAKCIWVGRELTMAAALSLLPLVRSVKILFSLKIYLFDQFILSSFLFLI
jgi:hypothetical protein